MLLALLHQAAGQDNVVVQRSRVEAAFLRNFAHYVSWPAEAFANERSPWTVCVMGGNHFGEALENTFRGREEQGRPFEIVRSAGVEQLTSCQIVFVAVENAELRRSILGRLKNRPVLTVGNAPDFLKEGGVIRLVAGERMEMSINLDQARVASLGIPAKLLEVSREVVENGTVRRLR